jgi:hypothetical protein
VGYLARIAILLSIAPLSASSADLMFRIPPVTTTVSIADQPVAVTVLGTVQVATHVTTHGTTQGTTQVTTHVTTGGETGQVVRLKLDADLSDLQRQIE